MEKKREVNHGIAPQYYVEDSHEAIIPKDYYMRVQEEMVRRANLRSGEHGQKNEFTVANMHFPVSAPVKNDPKVCDAPTIQETDLQAAIMKAINQILGIKSTVIKTMKTVMEQSLGSDTGDEIAAIDSRLEILQK